ncbi:sugar ABC transporter permease [Kitasatospora sp. MAP5-34]|uniref:carbohydrate ABC transporter permease n=1 Tax=Kitasatospora sp. MAP5-34 TaxID=3035102 RepID=UPI00247505F8|nr:sugar ABC transporter permease [Kitasatospora sp. MAP5-34]MDH6576554.1 alpha-glucoside transport system permease protein [Kitasatospora sp. MAP5-34]
MPTASLADSAWTDAITKLGNSFGAVAIFLGILLVVFFAAGRATGRLTRPLAIGVFLGPAVLLLIVGLVAPLVRTVYLSFYNDDSTRFLGGKNYGWALTTDSIHQVLLNTLLWLVFAPLAATGLGLVLALLVERMRYQALYKSLIFMPMAVSLVGASIIWKFVYETRDSSQQQVGLLSQLAISLGWRHPPNWILSHPLNNFLLMAVMVWVQTGFAMVVLSAAIKAIPDEVTEAARLDGARGLKLFWFVTVPMIRTTLVVVLTTVMITTLKAFDIVRTMTGGNFGTQVLANEMYSQSFVQFNVGRGSALAVILFLAVLPLVAYNIVQLRKERETR